MTGFMTGQQMLGYQPYQGPMPFQQQGAFPSTANAGGMPGMGATPSLTGMQGFDSFSGMGNMGGMGMPQMSGMQGMMGGSPAISGSTLQMMAQINSMMASVMQGLMQFVQVLMQSVAQKQSQQSSSGGETSTGTGTDDGSSSTSGKPSTSTGSPTDVKSGSTEDAIKFFMSEDGGGWTREQAAGIVANLKHESGLRTNAVGDGGQAYGVAQWHPDRQANFTKFAKSKGFQHTSIKDATLAEQLAFVNYELTQGNEKKAGDALRGTSDAKSAAAAFCRYYERPADVAGQSAQRGATASEIV